MGNIVGSCLGVGRPMRHGSNNTHLISSNLVNVNSSPFGSTPGRNHMLPRLPANGSRQTCLGGTPKGLPLPKLMRQSSSLSTNQQQPLQQQQNNVPKLVDIDDQPSMPIDKSAQICGRKQNGNTNNNIPTDPQTAFAQTIRMNPSEVKLLIALYDYETKSSDDLGFHKGEHLETTLSLMNGDWWMARSKSTKKIGYVPSNYVAELKTLKAEEWYMAKIGRVEAEKQLKLPENKDGAFIIRDSDTSRDQYSLSLRHEDEVKHYRIKQFEAGGFYINQKKVFSTIHELVAHYSTEADGLCINLRKACITRLDKPKPFGLSYDTCDQWEVDRKRLTILHKLGHGQFGEVFEGLYDNKTRVAIKTLKSGSMDPKDFLAEAQIMKKMHHDNLVQLYAVCTREEPVFIITELMCKGALLNYLHTDEGKSLSLIDHILMATQIADGMRYLEREKYVHRDLAARNILVGENNVCKIADFGLARFIKETEYEARAGARFPIKWTAPEAANYSKFTIKSDVWSFGIVLYEIITQGGVPYPDMTNAVVLARIDKGYRMPQPPNCETRFYQIMLECWHRDPNRRPTFETLHWKLSDYFTPDEQYREASQFRER